MKLGFTFDEKILNKISTEKILHKARINNIKSIELSPDENILSKSKYLNIAKTANENDILLNYHVPYFINELYEIYNLKEYKNIVAQKYIKMFNLISELNSFRDCRPTIVFHGAKYEKNCNKNDGIYSTLSFIDWGLNYIEKNDLNFCLALETVNKTDMRTIGDYKEEVIEIINKFDNKNLRICLDICHNEYNCYPEKPIYEEVFLKLVNYVHVHGVNLNKNISHISITKSDIDFSETIKLFNDSNIILNLELLVNYCGDDYIKDLFNDIAFINGF